MSDFDTAAGEAMTVRLNVFGETITYTPSGGAGSSITAVCSNLAVDVDHYPDGDAAVTRGQVLVSSDDVTQPGRGDSVAVDSVTYRVVGWQRVAGGWVCDVSQSEILERSLGEVRRARR